MVPVIPAPGEKRHHQVLIIGGGNAGVSLAGRLKRYRLKDIAVIEPRSRHLYQPLFSHIAGGTADAFEAVRLQSAVMPRGITWIQDKATDVSTESSTVLLESGSAVTYDHLVVCPGIQNDWTAIPGLKEAMEGPYGGSNYEYELAPKAWKLFRDLTSGTVVFTQPPGPASCDGAAQKPMYLACDHWRRQGVLKDIRVVLAVSTPTIFGMEIIDEELNRKIDEYGIEVHYSTRLESVDPEARTVVLRRSTDDTTETIGYDVLHAVPPQSAPEWLKSTDLPAPGNRGGFVEVDPVILRHTRFPTIWSLGDAASTLNSKSGAALRMQTKVLAKNLKAVLKGKKPTSKYNHYSACPFVVSRKTVVFSEFDDKYSPMPTVPGWKNLARERRSTFIVERVVLPKVYWNLILKGRA
ncbi:NAD(P)/FAD-dependent oxidoreductase [Arthrobacter sedimenti]|uniref:NAD(P)/FAD-dependent oxidoreductase n=1 Tax=Arthrobacter sedimenti TaxID=2694931 RepID=UPI000B355E42|nr:FAD-dependent oxidoreductase [Arthrobacter sedimenti]OUM41146.1 pyridine nucleotide-disulfide oxidoreductase [Arthrobacter agilis]